MLAALNQHCRPELVADTFMTLLLLFNDSMGASEDIMFFCSWLNGMVNCMAHCKIFLPSILIVMFFLRSLHSCTMTSWNNFAPIKKPMKAPPSILLWRTFATTMNLSWSDQIRNFLWSKLLKQQLLLPPLKRKNREKSGTTRMNGLPPSTSKASKNVGRAHWPVWDSVQSVIAMGTSRTEQLRKLGRFNTTTQTSLTIWSLYTLQARVQNSIAVGTAERGLSPSRMSCPWELFSPCQVVPSICIY